MWRLLQKNMNRNEGKDFKSSEKMHNALITLLDSKDLSEERILGRDYQQERKL